MRFPYFHREAFVQLKNVAKNIGVQIWNLVPPHLIGGYHGSVIENSLCYCEILIM